MKFWRKMGLASDEIRLGSVSDESARLSSKRCFYATGTIRRLLRQSRNNVTVNQKRRGGDAVRSDAD
jgi:hypothetical protein